MVAPVASQIPDNSVSVSVAQRAVPAGKTFESTVERSGADKGGGVALAKTAPESPTNLPKADPPTDFRSLGITLLASKPTGDTKSASRLPDTTSMTEAQKYDYYAPLLDSSARSDVTAGKKAVIGLRQSTPLSTNNGKGAYNDRIVVLWKDGSAKHAKELPANTQPSGQYGAGGKRASHGQPDLGVLRTGAYRFDPDKPYLGDTAYRSEKTQPVDRYQPVNGRYNENAPKKPDETGAAKTMQIHTGAADNTWSAGCQTMPPEVFSQFKALVGKQSSFAYDLVDVSQMGNTASITGKNKPAMID